MILPEPFEFYAEYHAFHRDAPGFKVLDNGMFETGEPLNYDKLVGYAYLARADEIILPDIAGDTRHTNEMIDRFIERWKSQPKPGLIQLAAVVQGKSEGQLFRHADHLLQRSDIHTIMIPKRVGAHDGSLRGRIAQFIKDENPKMQVHFLGLNQEHAQQEVVAAGTTGVRSIDCTHPFKCALTGISVNHPRASDVPRRPGEYWNAWMSPDQLLLAQENIEAMNAWRC